MKPPALLREYCPADLPEVVAVYADAVRSAAPAFYTPAQVGAWAAFADRADELAPLLAQGYRLVLENDGGIDAFAVLDPADYISLLYCRGRASRRGYGSRLLDALETEARSRGIVRVRTAASLVSHPLFLRHGYRVDEAEHVERQGVAFDRYRMSKRL